MQPKRRKSEKHAEDSGQDKGEANQLQARNGRANTDAGVSGKEQTLALSSRTATRPYNISHIYSPSAFEPSPDSPRRTVQYYTTSRSSDGRKRDIAARAQHFLPAPEPSLSSSTFPSTGQPDPINNSNLNRKSRSRSVGDVNGTVTNHLLRGPLALENGETDLDPTHLHTEIVPYVREWRIILRNDRQGEVVLFNPANRSIAIQRSSNSEPEPTSLSGRAVCEMCHRPLPVYDNSHGDVPTYMDQNYFRLLASATQTPNTSRPASPTSDRTLNDAIPRQFGAFGSTEQAESPSSFPSTSNLPSAAPIHLNVDAFNQGYYAKFFMEVEKLGKGFRGSVFLCQHVLDDVPLGQYAVKKVAVGDNHTWLVRMLREVHLLERLHHPNIVDYKHAWLENHRLSLWGPEVPCLFILMECANGGNLEEYIEGGDSPDQGLTCRQPDLDAPSQDSKARKMSAKERKKMLRAKIAQTEHDQEIREHPELEDQQKEKLNKPRKQLSLEEIWSIFLDTCQGLAHLHRHNIAHRDLKPPNLLLYYDDLDKRSTSVLDGEVVDETVDGLHRKRRRGIPRVLISDFGECEVLDEKTERDRTGATGTLEFMAPELVTLDTRAKGSSPSSSAHTSGLDTTESMRLSDKSRKAIDYSPKSDMWSLGMILYYLCYSQLPYKHIYDVDLLKREILDFGGFQDTDATTSITQTIIDQAPPRPDIPTMMKELIRLLLSKNPNKRPSCEEILSKVEAMSRGGLVGVTLNRRRGSHVLGEGGSVRQHDVFPPTNSSSDKRMDFAHGSDGFVSQGITVIEPTPNSTPKRSLDLDADDIADPILDPDNANESISAIDGMRKRQRTIPNDIDGILHHPQALSLPKLLESQPVHAVDQHHPVDNFTKAVFFLVRIGRTLLNAEAANICDSILQEGDWKSLLKTIGCILKVASCTVPCYPYAPKPNILFLVLLLAILDLRSNRKITSLLLVLLHVGILSFYLRSGRGGMCAIA
ncbi:hypothetical protein BZG36_00883 [Bifiguratus adelaidae]|uniref:non-specific serine/threonine protein kinase n=1 Tax=Bifiguratus adelaidae TaxID=1938954 RepID=A0A261Y5I1_9FUNG|nr:hypothetical protein BZG36_00883 [Bifiguratus adelaidae]